MSRRNQSGKRIAISFNPKELEAELHAERRASTVKVVDGLADWERELLSDQTKTDDERPVTFMPTEGDLAMKQIDRMDYGDAQIPVHNPFGIELGL